MGRLNNRHDLFDDNERDDTVGDNMKRQIKVFSIGALVFVLIISILGLLFGSLYNVGEGEVGVKFAKFGPNKGFSSTELSQGYGFKMPFRDRVITMTFRTQTVSFNADGTGDYGVITPKDSNGINYNIDVTIRYKIDPTQASEFIEQKGAGVEAMTTLLATAVRGDSTRGVLGKYPQEDIPEHRTAIAEEIRTVLQKRINKEATGKLKPGFITIEAVDLRNVLFDPRIEEAIVNKQTQKQIAEKKEYELQQAEMEKKIAIVQAEKNKEANILMAEGEAKAVLLVATAKAEGITKVNIAYQQMPASYVQVKFAEAIKPTDKIYLGFDSLGGNSMNFFDINQATGLVYEKKVVTEGGK